MSGTSEYFSKKGNKYLSSLEKKIIEKNIFNDRSEQSKSYCRWFKNDPIMNEPMCMDQRTWLEINFKNFFHERSFSKKR
jgi:hypothetical protein